MPAGLDGNPDPIVSAARTEVLTAVADMVSLALAERSRVLLAVDGRSGAGKSTFADELPGKLRELGIAALRSTTDSFHQPRVDRMRLGANSAEGYYADSHQITRIVDELLEPFATGESLVRVAAFDEPTDQALDETAIVADSSVLIFDGLFLQRPEFRPFWNHSVFLTADERLDAAWLHFLLSDLPSGPTDRAQRIDERLRRARWPRYRDGWSRYLEADKPDERVDFVIDNNDFASPFIVRS